MFELPKWTWERCAELVQRSRRAELRGWQLAAAELRRDLAYTLPTLQSELTAIISQLPALSTTRTTATVGDVYGDLAVLQQEFAELAYDVHERWLSVTTEPITLEGVYLGPFEIRLDWGRIRDDSAYRVIASDPHPPEPRENVTHPHVMDEILCEGHSRHSIRQAMVQGRLLDFFTLVANGLRTYNEESPFVALDLWSGVSCSDCGSVVDDDERYVCQRCEETICPGCETTCCGCDDSYCSQCITVCEACDDNFCRACLKPCKECRQNICPGCIQEDERCSTCHEKEEREEDSAAVQPLCVGQAAVPA
jgi:hypothetical protein